MSKSRAWRYMVLAFPNPTVEEYLANDHTAAINRMAARLNELGDEGWEAFAAPIPGLFYLKRELTEDEP